MSDKVPCPNPDCGGWVDPSQKRCLKCRHTLMKCPKCGHVMSVDIGFCGFCASERKAEPTRSESPASQPPLPLPKTQKEELMWSADDAMRSLAAALATAYYDAAAASADMRIATEALEAVRLALLSLKEPHKVWDEIDRQIGRAEEKRLRPAIMKLRDAFQEAFKTKLINALQEQLQADPEVGWREWLRAYAEATSVWRVQICSELAEARLPFPAELIPTVEMIRRCTRYILRERWTETWPLFVYLADQDFLETRHRARLNVILGQIQLYHFFKPDSAKGFFELAARLAPEDGMAIAGMGEYWLDNKEFEKAKEQFQLAIDSSLGKTNGYLCMGDLIGRQGNWDEAEKLYQEAVRLESGYTDGYMRLLRLYGRPDYFGTYKEALGSLVSTVIAIDDTARYGVYLSMGDIFTQNSDYEEAHAWYQKAIDRDDTRMGGHISEGYAYLETGNYDQARKSFEKAVELAPEALDGYWGLALLYEQQEAWAQALDYYQKSLLRRPEWTGEIRYKIGEMKRKLGRHAEAEKELIQALRAEPDNLPILNSLHDLASDYYQQQGNPAAAVKLYDNILAIKGQSFAADQQNQMGNLHYAAGHYAEAVEAYQAAISIDPSLPVYHSNLALVYEELKEWAKAQDEYKNAFRLDKNRDKYDDNLASLHNAEGNDYYFKGEYRQAIACYKKAIKLKTKAVYYDNMAGAWEKNKDLDNAIDSLRKAIELDPHNKDYLDSLDRLTGMAAIYPWTGESPDSSSLDLLLPVVTPIAMEVGTDLIPLVEGYGEESLSEIAAKQISASKVRIQQEFGVKVPGVRIRSNETDIPSGNYILMLNEIPIFSETISLDKRLFPDSTEELSSLGIIVEETVNPLTGKECCWVRQEDWKKVLDSGRELWELLEYPLGHLERVIRDNLGMFFGHQELMNRLGEEAPEIHQQLQESPVLLSALVRVIRELLQEKTPILHLSAIAGKFLELSQARTPYRTIVEIVRSLPEIRPSLWGNNNQFHFYELDLNFESSVKSSLRKNNGLMILDMDPKDYSSCLTTVREDIGGLQNQALLVRDPEIRPFVSQLIHLEFPQFPVLSKQEVLSELKK